MPVFKINTQTSITTELNEYRFKNEGSDCISPQELLAKNPQIILSIPSLELPPSNSALIIREFCTSRGPIDILIITENADILLIETKLYRNPESHRTVVAQAIDYVKAFSDTDIEALKTKFLSSKYTDAGLVNNLFGKEGFCIALKKNIRNGYFKVLIIGDKIHSNVLGMVESIDSAPHLAFTIYLVELLPTRYDDNHIILKPKILENTVEIERSVIRLEVDLCKETYKVESSTPVKDSKGSRPIINEEQYINSLTNPSFAEPIKEFWKKWRALEGDVRFGTVGFSAGFKYGNRRIPLQFVMDYKIDLVSDAYRKSYDISDSIYKDYKEFLKNRVPKAFDHLIANHVTLPFEYLTREDLDNVLNATIKLAQGVIEN
jgi:hypothetical protein